MPIYEDKLISPLAVRFTQEHIRPVFQDGSNLESTIAQIKTKPGIGPYDLILEAPFPSIEIVRWYQRHASGVAADAKHWCTMDNRRLYCLQRAAAALYPKRAAVVVEVLYAAKEGTMKKNDSSTSGHSVGIGHTPKTLTDRWEWRATEAAASSVIQEMVNADDNRMCVDDLVDAPAAPSMLDRFFAAEEEKASKPADVASDESTTHAPSPRSYAGSDLSTEGMKARGARKVAPAAKASCCEGLDGLWQGDQGEYYQVKASGPASWTCAKTDSAGNSKTYTLWYDEQGDAVWWGNQWSLYMDASQARSGSGQLSWYGANAGNGNRRRARFTWYQVDTPVTSSAPATSKRAAKATHHHEAKHSGARHQTAEPRSAQQPSVAQQHRGAPHCGTQQQGAHHGNKVSRNATQDVAPAYAAYAYAHLQGVYYSL